MLLVIPVSHVDLDRAWRLVERIAKYGGMKEEGVILSSTWKASWDMAPVGRALADQFKFVLRNEIATECEMGWPEAANHLFYETSKFVHERNFGEPWYFCEADNTPLRPGWFEALKQEYAAAGKPYMGVINSSRWVNQQTGEQFIRGKHMVGTGIYPADFLDRCQSIHRVDIVPWDVTIGYEILPEVHDTALISHHWGCQNATRAEDGLIYVESIDPVKGYNAGVIPAEAVVCHGVKDGSLDQVLDNTPSESEPASS